MIKNLEIEFGIARNEDYRELKELNRLTQSLQIQQNLNRKLLNELDPIVTNAEEEIGIERDNQSQLLMDKVQARVPP